MLEVLTQKLTAVFDKLGRKGKLNEELIAILGGEASRLASLTGLPAVALLVGLQGSGKTITAVKLAVHLKHQGQRPLLVAADTRRPAAIEQLKLLGERNDIPVYSEDGGATGTAIAKHALKQARS